MGFTRDWDASCPRVWDEFETAGIKWVIQDVAPEDDEIAIQILKEHFLDDELLSILSKLNEDPVSIRSVTEYWRNTLKQRMSLGCYTEIEGKKTLVALNVCEVISVEEKPAMKVEGAAWKNVQNAVTYIENKHNPFEYLGLDKILHAIGLVVKTEYRGHRLGSKILAARKPLSLSQGIKGTATLFTGPASQKSAARNGFETICTISLKELAEIGLNYPFDESRVVKLMAKKYFD